MTTFDEFLSIVGKSMESEYLTKEALCKATWDFQQAKIDRLMFEYCPDEMTPEQIKQFEVQQCITS